MALDHREVAATTTEAVGQSDIRLSPLYTIKEASWFLGMPSTTFRYWARGRGSSKALITVDPKAPRRHAVVPFIGLAEGLVVSIFRRHRGIKMQYLRRVLAVLEKEMGVDHALASRRLYSHGEAILFDYSPRDRETRDLVEVLTKNRVFEKVAQDYLKLITFGADDYASRLILPITKRPVIEIDPKRAFGQPLFVKGGARMEDVLARFRAGEDLDEVAHDYGVPLPHILDVIRAVIPTEAAA